MNKYIIIFNIFYPGKIKLYAQGFLSFFKDRDVVNLIDIREILSRIKFYANNLRYNSRKHFYLTTACLVVIIVLVFTAVFIKQRIEIAIYRVHICGEVYMPGVYDVEQGLRIADIIDLAGGATDSACLAAVNLAMEAGDGQRIYIPSFEEVEQGSSLYYRDSYQPYIDNSGSDVSGSSYGNIVNINTAGTSELEKLPGIGPATAKKIIDHRNKYGSFKSKEELLDISGIGPKKYGDIKDYIRL